MEAKICSRTPETCHSARIYVGWNWLAIAQLPGRIVRIKLHICNGTPPPNYVSPKWRTGVFTALSHRLFGVEERHCKSPKRCRETKAQACQLMSIDGQARRYISRDIRKMFKTSINANCAIIKRTISMKTVNLSSGEGLDKPLHSEDVTHRVIEVVFRVDSVIYLIISIRRL